MIRIVQLIDSLDAGGAERMAVNYANALQKKIHFSGLVSTRNEGALKTNINKNLSYLFLNKKSTFDFYAIRKLYRYCLTNQIQFIHAHSSSFFLAILVKCLIPRLKIIWHIHNGNIINSSKKKVLMFRLIALALSHVISVNKEIYNWLKVNKIFKKSVYLENFSIPNTTLELTNLNDEKKIKILQLANLKNPKNHLMTLKIVIEIIKKFEYCSFHLIGKDFNDAYSNNLKTKIKSDNLQNHVFIYGSKSDTEHIISQADICILTSESEGLPVALIEYGMQKKPVVCTAVGEIPNIINGKNGLLAEVNDVDGFSKHLIHLIENPVLRANMGQQFYQTIYENYSEEKVISKYLKMIVS